MWVAQVKWLFWQGALGAAGFEGAGGSEQSGIAVRERQSLVIRAI